MPLSTLLYVFVFFLFNFFLYVFFKLFYISSRYFANNEIRTDREICVFTVKMSQLDFFSISFLTDNSSSAVYSPETS